MTAMLRRWAVLVGLGLRLLYPSPAEARYARQILHSGVFDRAYYLASNPRLPLLCRIFPERHYVLRGEALGLCPSAAFSPRAYRYFNPDQGSSGLPPLAHYLSIGQGGLRITRDLPLGQMPLDQRQAGSDGAAQGLPQPTEISFVDPPVAHASAPHAVVLHVFYPGMWPELAARIAAQRFDFDLLVTLTGDLAGTAPLATAIRRDFPQARLWAMPNHGRDIYPFIYLLGAGVLRPYGAVCKLHTKKSPHRPDGDTWRRDLIGGVLGDPLITARRLAQFMAAPRAGLWVADGHLMRGADWWGPNQARAAALLARVGLTVGRDDLQFGAGSIYWIKPALLDQLAGLQLTAADFEPEMGQVDGTTAHAIERGLGVLADRAGLALLQSADLDRIR